MKTNIVSQVSKACSKKRAFRRDSGAGADLLRARIVQFAREKFLAFGVARVTTDEIASGLGISKATLYRHFGSKEEILTEAFELTMSEIRSHVESILTDPSIGFLDKIMRLMIHFGGWFSRLGPVLVQDLRRSAPQVWEEIERFRKQQILTKFRRLLEEGVREGVIRGDVDLDLSVQMYLGLIQKFFHPEMLLNSRHSASSILETLFKVFFEGVLTPRAREELSAREAGFDLIPKEVFR